MADIEFNVENKVAYIRLNRPKYKNAFTLDMIDAWADFLEKCIDDDKVGAVILTGAADSFCSGVDLRVMKSLSDQKSALVWKKVLWEKIHRIAFALQRLDKPVIAAVNGVAVGAGMDMALMCDMRFMAASAQLSEGYIRVGAVPGDGGCYFLPRLVGRAKALELLLSGDFVDAQEALRIGLVNRVYPDDDLLRATTSFAERLANQSPIALRMIKRAVDQSMGADLRTSLDLISSHMGVVLTTDDATEALAAFQEGRPANYQGK